MLNMNFVSIGISHWDAPVPVREKFSFSDEQISKIIIAARKSGVASIFVFSTCNRSQLFAYTDDIEYLKELFLMHSIASKTEFDQFVIVKTGDDAIRHLFEISSGLDSQILGDIQIIGQLKKGVVFAESLGTMKGNLQRLMQFVLQCYKKIRSETDLNSGTASVSHAALLLMKERFKELSEKKVLLYGIGKIGKTTSEHLHKQGLKNVTLINRTKKKAEELASRFNCKVASVDKLRDEIDAADIILVTTGSSQPTISVEHLIDLNLTGGKLFLDLSVPRNIDQRIKALPNVKVVDMDSLKDIKDRTIQTRKSAIPVAKEIIEDHMSAYKEWLHVRTISPTIKALKIKLEEIRKNEIELQLTKLTPKELDHIDLLSKSIVNRIANRTIDHLKIRSKTSPETEVMISEMFGLRA